MRLYVLIERLTLLRGVAMSILYMLMGVIKYSQTYDCSDLILVTRNTQRIRYIQERYRELLRIVNLIMIQSNRLTLNILSVKPIDIKHIALFYYKH